MDRWIDGSMDGGGGVGGRGGGGGGDVEHASAADICVGQEIGET